MSFPVNACAHANWFRPQGLEPGTPGTQASVAVRLIHLKLILAASFWATSPIFGRMLAHYHAPYALAAGRFLFATLALWLILRVRPLALQPIKKRDLPTFFLLGLTGICLHNVLVLMGVEYTAANRANVIFASISLMVALLDIVWLRRLPSGWAAFGLLVGILGTVVVVTDGQWSALGGGHIGRGECLVLASAACWALYSVLGRRPLTQYSPLTVVYYASLCGTALLVPFAALDLDVLPALLRDPSAWLMLAFVGCFNSALGFLWYYEAVVALGAMTSSAYINLVPVFGIVFSALLLRETASPALLLGGALVIAGLFLLERSPAAKSA